MNKQEKCCSIVDFEKCYKNKVFFDKRVLVMLDHSAAADNDIIVKIKEYLKRYPRLYLFLMKVVSPVYFSEKEKKNIIKKYIDRDGVILNVASGNIAIDSKIINVDLFNYPNNVDIISDATNLCVKDNLVDLVINVASLEHIYNYKKVISETHRILKKGGEAYFVVPFIQGFHASPHDFHRFTHVGLRNLFGEFGFKVKKLEIMAGAASGLTWVLTEFLAILFSFGSTKVYGFLFMFFTLLLFPLKFLDVFLNKIKLSKKIASAFFVIVEK